MAVKKYVTKQAMDSAMRKKASDKLPFFVQLSPMVFLTFNSAGLSLVRHYRASRIRDIKWVGDWDKLSVSEINQAFADQEWEIRI